jgi:hypothetical protein
MLSGIDDFALINSDQFVVSGNALFFSETLWLLIVADTVNS